MRYVFLTGICLLLLSSPVLSQHLYVTDNLKATFRTGPGNDHKIIRMVNSGEKLTVVETQEKWTMVRLPSGAEGWVLNQWLTDEVPKGIRLDKLQKKYDKLLNKYTALKEISGKSLEENKNLKSTLAICNKKEHDVRKDYEELKQGSGNYLQLKADYTNVKTSLEDCTNKSDLLNAKLTQKYILCALTGVGILLLGMIIGLSSKRKKRHSLLD